MTARPALDKKLDSKTFRDFYYLKNEFILIRLNRQAFEG